MAFIDYYKIMGIARDTPQADIRKLYLKRAKQFHPDLHPEDPKAKAKTQALNEAYAVLSDPDKRAKYDRYGEQWQQADAFETARHSGGFGNRGESGFYYSGSGGDEFDFSQFAGGGGGFSSFFESIFGQAAARGERGSSVRFGNNSAQYDMSATVNVNLYTALLGGEIILQTQTGGLRLKIKPETQNGTKVRLRGRGRQKPDGTYGNLIVTYNVRLPQGLTPRQRELLEEMRREGQS